jgi:hypothetical protein
MTETFACLHANLECQKEEGGDSRKQICLNSKEKTSSQNKFACLPGPEISDISTVFKLKMDRLLNTSVLMPTLPIGSKNWIFFFPSHSEG